MKFSNKSLLFRNLYLADGTGAPLKRRQVLVRNGKIAAVEEEILGSGAADSIVDCRKRVLAPGFIDAHGHSDLSALARPECFGKVSQGVTTEISGNCGLSPFPLSDRNRAHLEELYAQYAVRLAWQDFAGYSEELENRSVRLRLVPLVGHNTLRAAVAGYEPRPLSREEREEEKQLLERMLTQGVRGLSLGLLYVPGKFADAEELAELFSVVAAHDGIVTAHLRSEGKNLLESLQKFLEQAKRAHLRRLHVSHFKTAGSANWSKLDAAFALMADYRASSIPNLTMDRYSYTESLTQLSVILPGEAGDLPDREITRRLANPQYAAELELQLAAERTAEYFRTVRLANTSLPEYRKYIAHSITEFAEAEQITPAHAVIALLRHNSSECTAAFRGMSEENMHRIMDSEFCVAGTDESARPADDSIGRGHPRGFGGMVRFLRLQLDRHGSIERAVRQLTGKTAEIFQLSDRGIIRPGMDADLTLFDPDSVDGPADFSSPFEPAVGISFTVSGGNIIYPF